jgi:hypothetical protein
MRPSSSSRIVFTVVGALALVFSPFFALASASFNQNYILSDEDLLDADSMTLGEIQTFLENGTLATYRTIDIDNATRTAAEIIYRAARHNGVSARVILVMLQKEQSLVLDGAPSQDQLDWAMGYAVCDDCSHEDPDIQRFRGFAKQVNSATLQLTDGYMADLTSLGKTVMGFAPGESSMIDDTVVIPANNATAALYTYTPHVEGNQLFTALWQLWFGLDYPSGSLLQHNVDGGVWLIQYGERRPITSRAAFLSRFQESSLIPVSSSVLEAYPIGRPITLPNYSLVRDEAGRIDLLVDDARRHIVSMEAFRAIGFHEEDVIEVKNEDLTPYKHGEPITVDTVYPQGALLQDVGTGGVYYVENGIKKPIISREILAARFASRSIIASTREELETFETGDRVLFPDGTLIGVRGEPTISIVSEGQRRPIASASVFEEFGWKWGQVLWTDAKSVELHPLGPLLNRAVVDDDAEVLVTVAP